MAPTDLCVFCRRHPVDPVWRPFCSERCRMLDLAKWAEGGYRVPGQPITPPAEDSDEEP
jgi:uncharacterized protein